MTCEVAAFSAGPRMPGAQGGSAPLGLLAPAWSPDAGRVQICRRPVEAGCGATAGVHGCLAA
eukprot:12363775-Alexandrium_andersonii.AAC.1